MVVDFISLFRFVFIALFVEYIPGLSALRWTSPSSGSAGSVLYRCRHSNVTLSWSYVTNDNESVLATFWYSKRNGTLAHRLANQFTTMSERLTYDEDVGLTLSGLTSKDSGTYGMSVMLADWQSFESQEIELVVVEPPIVEGKGLIVLAQSVDSSQTFGNGSCQPSLQLRCGELVDIGSPPVSVVWTTPESGQLASSGYQDGYFLLDLPPHPKGGNYSCTLTPLPDALPCLQPWTSGSDIATLPSTMSASLLVETAETRVEKLEVTVGRLQGKLDLLETDRLTTHADSFVLHKDNLTEALGSLHSSVENITADFDTHGSKVELCLQGLSELNTTVQSELQSLKSTTDSLRLDLQEERRATFQQKAVITAQAKEIEDLKNGLAKVLVRLAHLEECSRDAEKVRTDLNSKTQLLHQETKEVETSLQQAVKDAESRLTAADSDLRRAIDTLTDNTSTRINHLSNITDIIDQRLTELSADMNELRFGAELRANQSESLTQKVTALHNTVTTVQTDNRNLIPRLTALETGLATAMRNVSSLALGTQAAVESLRLTNRSVESATSRLDQITNASIAFEAAAAQLNTKYDSLTQTVLTITNRPQMTDQQLTSMQNTVTETKNSLSGLVPRVTSLETAVQNVARLNNPVRLVGGNSSREGRVEIRIGYVWGTICDDNWDEADATVVCNMLGFHQPGARARLGAAYGQGTDPILLDDINCAGTEYDVRMCTSRPHGQHDCSHSEDAGVVCAG